MTATETPVAIVGVGKIARDQHVPALAANPAFRLAATVSRHGSVEGVPAYTDLAAMRAAHPEVTAVALCTPPQVRYDLAQDALAAGLDVLLEKPPGATVAEVEALARQARQADRVLFATWHSRFAPGVAPTKAWLAGREIVGGTVTWREDVRRWHPGQTWIWQPGGLGVFDPGINALSILTEILPVPLRLTAADLEFPANQQAPIAARLTLAAGSAAVAADFDFRQTGPQTWSIEIDTPDGRLDLSDGGARVTAAGRTLSQAEALASEYDGVYARFADLLARRDSEVDIAPLVHVADAFLLGRRLITDPFVD